MKPDRPCTSPRRNQCRAGGKPQEPDPWNPSHGWFHCPLPELDQPPAKPAEEKTE